MLFCIFFYNRYYWLVNKLGTDKLSEVYRIIFPYIDYEFYKANYGDMIDPVAHYIDNWRSLNINPSKFFSTSFYIQNNIDVADSGLNPLFHYVMHGQREGRLPREYHEISSDIGGLLEIPEELNLAGWGLPIYICNEKMLSNPYGSKKDLIEWASHTNAGCAIYKCDSNDWIVSFSGHNEKFYMLNKLSGCDRNVISVRDIKHTYYCSSPNLPDINNIGVYVKYHTENHSGNSVVVGQSSGGYCTLMVADQIDRSVSVAFSPQVWHPTINRSNVHFGHDVNKKVPGFKFNVLDVIRKSEKISRYAISGVTEFRHADSYYWGDLVSAGLLAATGKVTVSIVSQHEHATFRYLEAKKFFDLIFNNFLAFLNSPERGGSLLASSTLYYSRS